MPPFIRLLRLLAGPLLLAGLTTGAALAQPPPPPPTWDLWPSCPDPFCPDTTRSGAPHRVSLHVQQPVAAAIRLEVWSPDTVAVLATILDGVWPPGARVFTWNGRDSAGVPLADGDYPYRLTARDTTDGTLLFEDTKQMRVRCTNWWRLDANDPDGFCPTLVAGTPQGTSIEFFCPESGDVRLEVWSQDSSHVVRTLIDGPREAGTHQVSWDGLDDGGGVLANGTYPYFLTAFDFTLCGIDFRDSKRATIACVASAAPGAAPPFARLEPCRPNPFRGEGRFDFTLVAPARVRLRVFDLAGRAVRTVLDAERPAGASSAAWDGRDERGRAVSAGVYLARLEAGTFRGARTLILAR